VKKLLFAVALLCACSPAMLWAGVVVSVESKDVSYSSSEQTGWLYVYLQSTESPQPKLKSFDVRLNLSGGSGVTFLDAQKPPGTPRLDPLPATRDYILPSGAAYTPTLDLPTQITVSDIVLNSGDDIVDGRAFAQFQYKIAGGTPPGTHNLTVAGYTELFTAVGPSGSQPLPYTVSNGAINIVPEPGTLVLLCSGALILVAIVLRRRGRVAN